MAIVKKRNVLLMFITGFLLVLLFVPRMNTFAGTKKKAPRLTRTRLTLYTGKSKVLKVRGTKKKVKWRIKGKKLVTLTVKGKKHRKVVVRAGKKAGTCYVIARIGKKKRRCKIVVKKKKVPVKPKPAPKPEPGESLIENDFTRAMADTSIRLLQKTVETYGDSGNILISPDSILTALVMAQNGAGGETLSEMETAFGGIPAATYNKNLADLHKRISSSGKTTCKIANSLWYKEGALSMKDSYLSLLSTYYDAKVAAAPFDEQTVKDINGWVSENTNGKIPSIISRLEPSQRLVLANAVYFKGDWEQVYPDTVERTFTKTDGSTKTLPMLESTEEDYIKIKGGEGFVKYYRGRETAFVGILPPKGSSPGDFIKTLTGADFTDAYKKRMNTNVIVRTRMPQFKYEYSASLENVLPKLGMKKAFTDQADFSAMTDSAICIDQVLHKTFISLDKNGTEAAAATAIIAKASAAFMDYTVKEVYLDRPFVYGIIDTKTGLPLFIGIVNE